MNEKQSPDADDRRLLDKEEVTGEVGTEGGSPGDLEVATDRLPTTGSEATESVRVEKENRRVVVHDETGIGRRSP